MEELTSTENKVSFARQAYNDSVMGYNTAREVFPTNIIAGMFNFGPAESFKVEVPEQREAVKVTFCLNCSSQSRHAGEALSGLEFASGF